MLRRRRIKFYTSENEDLKASVVERFNRTLKTKMKMYRYFTHANTRRYFDVLDDLLTRRATGRKRFFEIVTRLPTSPVTYELRDLAGELTKGRFYERFYEPEVQKVTKSDREHFDVDRILKTRKTWWQDTVPRAVEWLSEQV